MQIDTNIWGDSSTWVKDIFFWSTDATFTDDILAWYNANPRKITDNINFAINTPIDYSICYAAHAANEKMPLADIEVYDYQGNKVLEQKETAGFFFCDYPNVSASYNDIWSWGAIKDNITADLQETGINWWLEKAETEYIGTLNYNGQTRPIVQFGIKSLFGAIRVALVKNDYSATVYLWLKELENNINTYKDNYHIEECYMPLYTYNGKTGDDFNPFTQNTRYKFNNIGGGGIAINKNLKIVGSDTEFNNYDMFVSNGYLPIFGTGLNNIVNYRNLGHYGIQISKRASLYYEYYDRSFAVCMASAADLGVSVYETTNEYGFPAYLLNPKMAITADNCEKLRKGAAAYGLFFTDDDPTTLLTDTTNNARWVNEKMYCGVLDDDGVGHGEYTKGTENITNDVYSRETSQDSPYNPDAHIDPNTYSDTTNFNSVNFINAFTRRYILNSTQVGQLASELWSANATKDPDDTMENFALDEYLTNNPIDTIVSLKYFPCTFADVAPATVFLGKYQTSIAGTALGTSVRIVDFAPIEVYRHFGDFRDFEPYTQISVYIPFCGTVTIPTAECMGHFVSVKLAIDTATGAATGFVIVSKSGSGGICVATATGTAAIDIPVSGLQSVNLQQAIFNATANWTQTQISNAKISTGLLTNLGKLTGSEKMQSLGRGFAKGISSGIPTTMQGLGNVAANLNPFNAMANAAEIDLENAKSNYELQHIEMPMRLIGSASPTLSTVIELQCRLIIYRPITDDSALASYGDTVGYACLKSGTVSQFSGLTVGTIDVRGINASEQEKAAIAASFANGVYL